MIFRTLYAKIFAWFLLTIALTALLLLLVAGLIGMQPFGSRWMALTQDMYAGSALDVYQTGGPPALKNYLSILEYNSGIQGYLLDSSGADVLGRTVPATLQPVLAESAKRNGSAGHVARIWSAASPLTARSGEHYVFAMQVHPLHKFLNGSFVRGLAPRLLLATLFIALFCLMLARHLTRPIRLLESAAGRLASGDLSVRTRPALGRRNDELTRMAGAFDSMAERIETLINSERQTLAEISHELRSPLTRLSVSLELLRRGETDLIPAMEADIERLNAMIGKVLDLARLDLDPAPLRTHSVDLNALMVDVVESANLEGRAEGKTVKLTASEVCTVPGEPALLASCVENLIRNALQHSPQNAEVSVTLERVSASALQLEIADCGHGVPLESLPHLFAPFYRVPDSRVARPSGTGLGLAIAERIARRHGGTLSAHNREPHGLVIRLQLPCLS